MTGKNINAIKALFVQVVNINYLLLKSKITFIFLVNLYDNNSVYFKSKTKLLAVETNMIRIRPLFGCRIYSLIGCSWSAENCSLRARICCSQYFPSANQGKA